MTGASGSTCSVACSPRARARTAGVLPDRDAACVNWWTAEPDRQLFRRPKPAPGTAGGADLITAVMVDMTSHTAWQGGSRRAATTGQAHRTGIRVAVRTADPLVHTGLIVLLRSASGIELVDHDSEAAVTVVVPDDADLVELLSDVKSPRLVLIADDLRQTELWSAIERGLIVLLPRGEATRRARLVQAISDACEGRGDLPAEHLGAVLRGLKLLHENTLSPRDLNFHGLSARETEVLRLLADGLDTAEIAERLIYSDRTVKNILHNLLSRLELRNRAHAVAYALRHGII
ncbi:response regulator transcription factor [Lentzea sp. NPDC060358]|uniref:helix-turn-helix transcriptional regulator n=1 Tax=Lentzea sp. NPDC060358 TaxID=3347103 RepID=UPI00364684F5